MKKLLFLAGLLVSTVVGFSQGTVVFSTGSANFITNAFTGAKLVVGSPIIFALYAGPSGSSSNALSAYGTTVSLSVDGRIIGPTFALTNSTLNLAAGTTNTFQIRGWDPAYGATYEAFLANNSKPADALVGASPLFDAGPAGGGLNPALALSGFFPGMVVVPEPTTYALGALGLGLIWMAKRRRE